MEIIIIIPGIVGIVFLMVGLIITNNRKKKEKNCTAKTNGEVTNIVARSIGYEYGEAKSLYPVFEYTIGEKKIEKVSSYGGSSCKYQIGQEIEIYYNPENYDEYYVAGDNIATKLGMIFTIAGIIIFMVTIALGVIL